MGLGSSHNHLSSFIRYTFNAKIFTYHTFEKQGQCSQPSSPSVLGPDEDGRHSVVPSRPGSKLPDTSEWRTSAPAIPRRPHLYQFL